MFKRSEPAFDFISSKNSDNKDTLKQKYALLAEFCGDRLAALLPTLPETETRETCTENGDVFLGDESTFRTGEDMLRVGTLNRYPTQIIVKSC